MRVDRKDAEKSLGNKGFIQNKSGDHVYYYYYYYKGKDTGIKTKISHGSKYSQIGADNLKKMKDQLRLDTLKEVQDLLRCPMTKERYSDILRKKGLLTE